MEEERGLKAVVAGAGGRMGRSIVRALVQDSGFELVGAFERKGNSFVGRDAGDLAGSGRAGIGIVDEVAKALLMGGDVLIDFSAPDATADNLTAVAPRGMAAVVGTTGHTPEQKAAIEGLSKSLPLVMAPNMSVGVNVMFRLIGEAARLLGKGYDVELLEAHHRFKKDAPSGTALRMAEVLSRARGWELGKVALHGREGILGERPGEEIGVMALRGGDLAGEHTVFFLGTGERLEIAHRSSSRDNFAIGALRAARWVVGKSPGLYDMFDVLGLK